MRFITGLIVGIILTIGVAYIVDASAPDTAGVRQTMVNWSVVDQNFAAIRERVSTEWSKLTRSASS